MITLKLDNPLAGFALTPGKHGDQVQVMSKEFLSSEDGEQLIARLEEISKFISPLIPGDERISESTTDHLLLIIKRDSTAELYVNELTITANIQTKRGVEKGDYIYEDDISDIDSIELGRDIPEDAGIIFLFSRGWRKGLFYDLLPLCPDQTDRDYNVKKTLASYFTYLSFQHLFGIEEKEFTELFSQSWFPFLSIKQSSIKEMLSFIRCDWSADEQLPQIAKELLDNLEVMMERWKTRFEFESHIPFFETAIERYREEDYLSTTSILYPRIEGILRSQTKMKPHKSNLARALVSNLDEEKIHSSLFLPHMFAKYLVDVYFKDFKPGEKPPLSRQSVGHGVAEAEDFSLKSATISFLTIDQIYYHLL